MLNNVKHWDLKHGFQTKLLCVSVLSYVHLNCILLVYKTFVGSNLHLYCTCSTRQAMTRTFGLLMLLSALCCSLADNVSTAWFSLEDHTSGFCMFQSINYKSYRLKKGGFLNACEICSLVSSHMCIHKENWNLLLTYFCQSNHLVCFKNFILELSFECLPCHYFPWTAVQ